MSGVVLYDGNYLAPFDGDTALEAVLDRARKTDFQEEAHKLSLSVTGGYGNTLEVTSSHFADRFSANLRAILGPLGVTIKAGRGEPLVKGGS